MERPGLPRRVRLAVGALLAAVAVVLGGQGCGPAPGPRARGVPVQDVYVWQRDWTPEVVEAVRTRSSRFGRLVVLAGEITWSGGRGEWAGVGWDPAVFREIRQPMGIALRVGPFPGPFLAEDAPAGFVRRQAREAVDRARAAGLEPVEFQLDFDCAERRLAGYRVWVEALRTDLQPLPVVITALPSWLGRREFAGLARAASGYVLQVHSVARPGTLQEDFELCDPDAARGWVEAAARLGVPFRVALPTYGYRLAFGSDGRYLGASAEGPAPVRPVGTRYREVGADPVRLAGLVAAWTEDRPAAMAGLVWYRLPVAGDRLNWRWPTLEQVMQGRAPVVRLVPSVRRPEPQLVEVQWTNAGTGDHVGPAGVTVRWQGARLVARDAIQGFQAESAREGEMLFTNAICRLPAGEVRTIGWLRFDSKPSVELIP